MSATIQDAELTPEERDRMEELRPLVEEAFLTILSMLAGQSIRSEVRRLVEKTDEAIAGSERVRREAEATMDRAELALGHP